MPEGGFESLDRKELMLEFLLTDRTAPRSIMTGLLLSGCLLYKIHQPKNRQQYRTYGKAVDAYGFVVCHLCRQIWTQKT